MSLNIKDEKVCKLAKLLANETGQSVTSAVKTALRERLETVRRRRSSTIRAALNAIGKRGAALCQQSSVNHGEFLYDENGLPK